VCVSLLKCVCVFTKVCVCLVKSTKFAAESTIFTDTVTTEFFENAEF